MNTERGSFRGSGEMRMPPFLMKRGGFMARSMGAWLLVGIERVGAGRWRGGKVLVMRTARAKVVNGKIVTKAKYPDGTKLTLVPDEAQPVIELDEEDREALDEAIEATRKGKLIPAETVRALLRTL